MGNRFASGKKAIAICDRCGFQFRLKELKALVIKTKNVNIIVCDECWEPDQPQLQIGMYPVNDPQAVRDPRPDTSYTASGTTGLQVSLTGGTDELGEGYQSEGSRNIQWGWNPVGGSRSFDNLLTPNALSLAVIIGTVQVTVS